MTFSPSLQYLLSIIKKEIYYLIILLDSICGPIGTWFKKIYQSQGKL